MALYVLDTGILLGYARGAAFAQYVEDRYTPTQSPNTALVSAVSIGEIKCFPIRRQWGVDKIAALEKLIAKLPIAPINHPSILDRYAEIATYCEGANPYKPLPTGISAHPMGDNDLWIAATTSVVKGTLITTDMDFLFLDKVFMDVIHIDSKKK